MPQQYALPQRIIDIHNHPSKQGDSSDLVELMDAAGIETTLVMGTFQNPNEQVLRAVRAHPGRLVGGAFIDPRDDDAVDQLARYCDQGLRVVKLFPNFGYYPDDDRFAPFFEKVAELGMAVLSHCGWLTPKAGVSVAYYSHPGRFEKLIRKYPDTPFILAHMGGIAGFLEAVMLTTRAPNAYVDCSPGQGAWVLSAAGTMAATIPPDKLMWGADSHDLQHWLEHYAQALGKVGFGPHFEKIFYGNARGILERIGAIGKEQP